ncbi:MAG: anhydro-N-acetylmuramic acid kinase [Pseudomonas marincola]
MDMVWAIGLMSGTSMDGIDAALIKTDGVHVLEYGAAVSIPYEPAFRSRFQAYLGTLSAPDDVINAFTDLNAEAVHQLIDRSNLSTEEVSIIGFHGQTLFHDAPNKITVQIGDGQRLADKCKIDVVNDFRSADVAAGGQGAPFAPLYHQALAQKIDGPIAVLNLGGVGNVTYINGDEILAFDTGPASALLDDWVREKTGVAFDEGGKIAQTGRVDETILKALLDHPYFTKIPPKSLDRDDFSKSSLEHLSLEDGAATLTAFTVKSVALSRDHLPMEPRRWLVAGGGRHNILMMQKIQTEMGNALVEPVENIGWRGDELEAEAFAFLAVRSRAQLPLSLPTTTGVPKPMMGGVFYKKAVI